MINLAAVIGAAILGAVFGYLFCHVQLEHRRHMHELRKATPMLRKTAYKLGAVLMVLVIGGFTIWTGVFG
jgi:polyferredoxin